MIDDAGVSGLQDTVCVARGRQSDKIPDTPWVLKVDRVRGIPFWALLVPFNDVVCAFGRVDLVVPCDGALVPFPFLASVIKEAEAEYGSVWEGIVLDALGVRWRGSGRCVVRGRVDWLVIDVWVRPILYAIG